MFTFKFSLILVSYFWLRPRFRGDYSALNWKQFNRLSIVFICLPYPLMMLACFYFLLFDGFFSYPGFVALEVIVLSTILMVLLLLDALSSIRCKTVGKEKTKKAIRVAEGADYDSDRDENETSKRAMKHYMNSARNSEQEEYGLSSYYEDSYDEKKHKFSRASGRKK